MKRGITVMVSSCLLVVAVAVALVRGWVSDFWRWLLMFARLRPFLSSLALARAQEGGAGGHLPTGT